MLGEGIYDIGINHLNGMCNDRDTIIIKNPADITNPAECLQLLNDTSFTVTASNPQAIYCLNISATSAPDFNITVNGILAALVPCDAKGNAVGVLLPVGAYSIRREHKNGICIDEATVTVANESTKSCNNLIGDSIFELTASATSVSFCLNIPITDNPSYTITNNGVVVNELLTSCVSNPALAGIALAAGMHDIVLSLIHI